MGQRACRYAEVKVMRIMTDAFMRTRGEADGEFNTLRYL
jgi:hypothetical protein